MSSAGKKAANGIKKIGDKAESIGARYGPTAGAYFANPLLAQNLSGARLASRGEGAVTAPGEAVSNPSGYVNDPRNQAELLQFNAALLAGAATGGALAPVGASLGVGLASAAGGVAAGAATQGLGDRVGTGNIDAARQDAIDQQQAAVSAEMAAATAQAGVAKDPSVAEIARQRAARGGRRGTILTAMGQTLGGSSGSKNLLGL